MADCRQLIRSVHNLDLKSILEEWEQSLKFNLIFNSGAEKWCEVVSSNWSDFDDLKIRLQTLRDCFLIDEEEYQALCNYFTLMVKQENEKAKVLKGEVV